MCRIGSQVETVSDRKQYTMCRIGSQVATEQQGVNEAMGEGGQSPAQRPGSYNPAQEPPMGYYTTNRVPFRIKM